MRVFARSLSGKSYDSFMSNGHVPPPLGNQSAAGSDSSGGKSCLFIGCISLVVLALIAVILTGVGINFLVKKGTSEAPAELPEYESKEGECDALQARFTAFEKEGGTLALTADDLNAAIACNPDLEILKGKAWIKIEDDQLVVDGSFPLTAIIGFRDRYFNGTLSLHVHKDAGDLEIYFTDIDIEGHTLPQEFIDMFSGQNMAKDLKDSPELDAFLDKMESIEIKDGQVVLTKGNGAKQSAP